MSTNKVHAKMSPEDRAKQFMPFAALKGYEEALRRAEIENEKMAERKPEPFPDDLNAGPSDIP